MSKTLREIVESIQFFHSKEKWTIENVAKSVGKERITLQRAMKKPDTKAAKAIRALLLDTHPEAIQNVSHTDQLIQVLKEKNAEEKRILEEHSAFLQDLVREYLVKAGSNLGELAIGQRLIQAQVRAVHQWDAKLGSNGDPKKEDELLKQTGKRINDNFLESQQGGIPGSNGN